MKFIAIGPFCWGKGDTHVEAVANCRKEAPRRGSYCYIGPFRCIVFTSTDDAATVDGMGAICHAQGATVTRVAFVGRWTKAQLEQAGYTDELRTTVRARAQERDELGIHHGDNK